jgi:hypothetical protein
MPFGRERTLIRLVGEPVEYILAGLALAFTTVEVSLNLR